MKKLTQIIAALSIVTILVVCAYFLGRIHENRNGTQWAFSKIITDNIWAAKHIRNNNIENALGILEVNADFFSRALSNQPSGFLPNKEEIHVMLNPSVYPIQDSVENKDKALSLENKYASAYPDMRDRIETIRARSVSSPKTQ